MLTGRVEPQLPVGKTAAHWIRAQFTRTGSVYGSAEKRSFRKGPVFIELRPRPPKKNNQGFKLKKYYIVVFKGFLEGSWQPSCNAKLN